VQCVPHGGQPSGTLAVLLCCFHSPVPMIAGLDLATILRWVHLKENFFVVAMADRTLRIQSMQVLIGGFSGLGSYCRSTGCLCSSDMTL
jgi:hypothetical protein